MNARDSFCRNHRSGENDKNGVGPAKPGTSLRSDNTKSVDYLLLSVDKLSPADALKG